MTHYWSGVLLAVVLGVPTAGAQGGPGGVTTREIESLKRQIRQETRSHAELILEGRTETGGLNDRLDLWRFGARVDLKAGKSGGTVHLAALHTRYSTLDDVVTASSNRVAAGFRGKVFEDWEAQLELGATRFDTDVTTVDGLASFSTKPSDSARVRLAASRTNIEESLLSAAGLRPALGPFAGGRVGSVMENRLTVGGDYRLPLRLDVYAEASLGTRGGAEVPSNAFRRAGGGLGWSAVGRDPATTLSLLRLSVVADYFGFDEDRLGYGGASLLDDSGRPIPLPQLGSDGLSPEPTEGRPGLGGYFSPARFSSVLGRVDLRGKPRPSLEYRVSVFAGRQSYTGSAARTAGGFTGTLEWDLGDRLSLPLTLVWEDYGPFRQQSLLARLLVRF